MIKSIIWASMLDYPGHVCTTLFFDNCNFGCEFCQNKDMKDMKNIDFDCEILPKLLERKEMVEYVVLSGGECTIDGNIDSIIDTLVNNGFKVGIHTNGYKPQFFKDNIDKISFVGMDIKNEFDNYDEICNICDIDINKIKESIDIVINSKFDYEFRTTVYPKFVDEDNCVNIAKYLKEKKAKLYVLQQYKKIEGTYDVNPYNEEKMIRIQEKCNKYVRTKLRGLK